jgi:hypothetical protein
LTEGLAWEASGDDVNVSSPGRSVEGPDVVPDGESVEVSVALPGEDDAPSEFVVLDGCASSPVKELGSEKSASSSGK